MIRNSVEVQNANNETDSLQSLMIEYNLFVMMNGTGFRTEHKDKIV